MSSATLSSVAGILLSLAFSYILGLNSWFDTLDSTYKRLIMLAALLVVAAGSFGLSCSGWWDFVTCDQGGIVELIEAFVAASIANQMAYKLSPRSDK